MATNKVKEILNNLKGGKNVRYLRTKRKGKGVFAACL